MDSMAQWLNYLRTNYKTNNTLINGNLIDPGYTLDDLDTRVIIGETMSPEGVSWLGLPDSAYPRVEILIGKIKDDGYVNQCDIHSAFRFSVAGYMLRETEATLSQDMYNLIQLGRDIKNLTMKANNDKIQGITVCDGFLYVGGYSETFFEYEIAIPKCSSFIFVAEAKVDLEYDYNNS